jgi:hypothetical protein
MQLNRAKSNATGCRRQAFAPTRDVARRGHVGRATDRPGATAGALLRPPVPRAPRGKCRGVGRRLHRLPPPLPSRHAPRAHGPAAPTMSQSPNHVAAVPGSRAPPYRAPSRGRVGTCAPRHTRLYKGQKLAGHTRCAVAQSRVAPPWLSTLSSRAHSVP